MDDEDDFFAYQTTKSLNSKRSRLKQFLQAPPTAVQSKKQQDEDSTSSSSDFDTDDNLIGLKKSKRPPVNMMPPVIVVGNSAALLPPSSSPSKPQDSIRTEIDAIVTSCFASNNKDHEKIRRKIQLNKRTAADDQDFDEEDEREYYGDQFSIQKRGGRAANMSRALLGRRPMQHSSMETDDDKVTRETAAYDRLDAVLRVTKPLCEKQIDSIDDDEDEALQQTVKSNVGLSPLPSFDAITLKVDHSDGRQLIFTLPLSTKLSVLYAEVAERLSIPSIHLVHNNQTLKLDVDGSRTLKQLNFSSDHNELLESYPLTRKLKIIIQSASSSSSRESRRSSLSVKREYTMLETDRFETVFDAYKRDMRSDNVRFEFDGDTLHAQATPADYEMADEEILDAFITSSESKKVNRTTKKVIAFDDTDSDR